MKNLRSGKLNKKILAILVVIVLAVVFAPQGAAAQVKETAGYLADYATGAIALPITGTIAGLLYIVKTISAWIITFIAFLADTFINFGNDVLKMPAVTIGWSIMLNFTNLGFVLAIIVIAFATILRMENYAMKKILWKLIVAALLVNFSLVIAGAVISISKLSTDYFFNAISDNGTKSMGDVLGNLTNPQKLEQPPSESWVATIADKTKDALNMLAFTGAMKTIIGLIFQIIMNFIIILTFLTLIIMLLIRAIALIFLLIFSPIVWLLWIFPNTQKYWTQWWSEFIRWNFFAPAIMFFIYLAVATQKEIGKLLNISTKAKEALTIYIPLPEGAWDQIMNNIVILALLIGGIVVANKFSIAGSSIGINWAQGAGKWAGGKAKGKAWGGVKGGYSRLAGKAGWGDKSIEASKQATESTSRVGRFWHSLKAKTYANLSAPVEKEHEAYKAEVAKLTTNQAMAQLSSQSIMMPGGKKIALAEYVKDNVSKIHMPGKNEKGEDISDKLKQDWLEKNLATDSMENLYKRSKMDYSALTKKSLGQSKDMVDARNEHGLDSEEFAKAAAKFYGGLKKSDAADIGKSLKRIYSPGGMSDKDGKLLARYIAKALGGNIPIISSILPHLGGYKIVNNFQTEFEQANPHIEEESVQAIFKNFKIFEGGAPSSATASTSKT